MKTIAFALLTACCWLVAGEMVRAQSALQRLEEMIRQPKADSAAAPTKPPESPAPPKAAATQPPHEPQEPGYLGVLADDKDDRGRGVRVLKVVPGGPADQAGLKPQDLITRLGGVPVRQMTRADRHRAANVARREALLRGPPRRPQTRAVGALRSPSAGTAPLAAGGASCRGPSTFGGRVTSNGAGAGDPVPGRSGDSRLARRPPVGCPCSSGQRPRGWRCPRRDRPPPAPHRRVGEARGPVGAGAFGEEVGASLRGRVRTT